MQISHQGRQVGRISAAEQPGVVVGVDHHLDLGALASIEKRLDVVLHVGEGPPLWRPECDRACARASEAERDLECDGCRRQREELVEVGLGRFAAPEDRVEESHAPTLPHVVSPDDAAVQAWDLAEVTPLSYDAPE